MKYIAAILVLATILTSCHSNSDIKSTSPDSTIAKKPQGYEVKQLAGVFYDTLPCAGCRGLAAKVYLKPDETFIMEREYIGKNTTYETGTWTMRDSLLQLNGTDSLQHFKIANYTDLQLLDNNGKAMMAGTKTLELHRNNVPFKPLHPVPVAGLFKANGDTVVLHICSMNHDYQASLAPAAQMMTAKYKQAAKDGQPIYAKLAGHFELRPSLHDTTTQDFFVVEKFIQFVPGQGCK